MKATLVIAIALLGSSLMFAAPNDAVRVVLEWPGGSKAPTHAWKWGDGAPARFVVSEHKSGSTFESVPKSWDVQVDTKKGLTHPRLRITHIASDQVEVEIRIVVSDSETSTIWLRPNYSYELNGDSEVFVRVIPRRKPPQSENMMQQTPVADAAQAAR
jgi:anti-sigma factor RsiW